MFELEHMVVFGIFVSEGIEDFHPYLFFFVGSVGEDEVVEVVSLKNLLQEVVDGIQSQGVKHILHEVERRSIDLQSTQYNFFSLLIFQQMRENSKDFMQYLIGNGFDGSDVDSVQEKMDNFLPFSS